MILAMLLAPQAYRLPCDHIRFLPVLYTTWSLCRIIYLYGYLTTGSGRMLGFPGTVLPTLAGLAYAVWLSVNDGVY